jgi:thioredoxin reductase (NADPH)
MEQQLIILGSGPAGYTSAIYAARANLSPTLITGLEVGGQLTTTTEVENWPGDYEDLQGPDLMVRMKKHAEKYNVNIINDHIKSVDFSNNPLVLNGQKDSYLSNSLIIATGASAKYLGLESEKTFLGKDSFTRTKKWQ